MASMGPFALLSLDGKKLCFARYEDLTEFTLADASEGNICGKLDHDKEDVDSGPVIPRIRFYFQPAPQEIEVLLPLVGSTKSGTDFVLNDNLNSVNVEAVLGRIASVDTYSGGKVDKFIIRGQKGSVPLQFELEVVFKSVEIDTGKPFSATSVAGKTAPFWLHTGNVLTLNSGEVKIQSFVHVTDNHLNVQHNNSVFPTDIDPGDRTHHLGIDTPYTSSEVGLLTAFSGSKNNGSDDVTASVAGYAGSIKFSRGSGTEEFTISYHNLKSSVKYPSVLGKEEIRNKMFFNAYGSGSTKPVTFSLKLPSGGSGGGGGGGGT